MTPAEARAALAARHEVWTPDEIASAALATIEAFASTDNLVHELLDLVDRLLSYMETSDQARVGYQTVIRQIESLFACHKKAAARQLLREAAADEIVRNTHERFDRNQYVPLSSFLTVP